MPPRSWSLEYELPLQRAFMLGDRFPMRDNLTREKVGEVHVVAIWPCGNRIFIDLEQVS